MIYPVKKAERFFYLLIIRSSVFKQYLSKSWFGGCFVGRQRAIAFVEKNLILLS